MLCDNYLRNVVAAARAMTDRVEQRTLAILRERGDLAGLTCDEQIEVERQLRELLGEPEAEPHDSIYETLIKAHQGLQFPVDDLRGLYGKVDPLTLIIVERIHKQLVKSERDLGMLVTAHEEKGETTNGE